MIFHGDFPSYSEEPQANGRMDDVSEITVRCMDSYFQNIEQNISRKSNVHFLANKAFLEEASARWHYTVLRSSDCCCRWEDLCFSLRGNASGKNQQETFHLNVSTHVRDFLKK